MNSFCSDLIGRKSTWRPTRTHQNKTCLVFLASEQNIAQSTRLGWELLTLGPVGVEPLPLVDPRLGAMVSVLPLPVILRFEALSRVGAMVSRPRRAVSVVSSRLGSSVSRRCFRARTGPRSHRCPSTVAMSCLVCVAWSFSGKNCTIRKRRRLIRIAASDNDSWKCENWLQLSNANVNANALAVA